MSLLSIEDGVFQVLATNGDTRLGGDDFDQALVGLAVDGLRERVPAALLEDLAFPQAARLAAERCKIALSRDPEADLHLTLPDHDLTGAVVTREELRRSSSLIERTLQSRRRALLDADLEVDVDEVVLVGGSTACCRPRRGRASSAASRTPS